MPVIDVHITDTYLQNDTSSTWVRPNKGNRDGVGCDIQRYEPYNVPYSSNDFSLPQMCLCFIANTQNYSHKQVHFLWL